jgi:hypothetical protein
MSKQKKLEATEGGDSPGSDYSIFGRALFPTENKSLFQKLTADLMAELAPQGALETSIVLRIASRTWRLDNLGIFHQAREAAREVKPFLQGRTLEEAKMVRNTIAFNMLIEEVERAQARKAGNVEKIEGGESVRAKRTLVSSLRVEKTDKAEAREPSKVESERVPGSTAANAATAGAEQSVGAERKPVSGSAVGEVHKAEARESVKVETGEPAKAEQERVSSPMERLVGREEFEKFEKAIEKYQSDKGDLEVYADATEALTKIFGQTTVQNMLDEAGDGDTLELGYLADVATERAYLTELEVARKIAQEIDEDVARLERLQTARRKSRDPPHRRSPLVPPYQLESKR